MRRLRTTFSQLLFLICCTSAASAGKLTLIVVDSLSGEPVKHAMVCRLYRDRPCIQCDSLGYCRIPVPVEPEWRYLISAPGYDTIPFEFPDTLESVFLYDTIRLSSAGGIKSLQMMVVKGSRSAEHRQFSSTSLISYGQNDLLEAAGTGKDINRLLALNASVVSMGTYDDNGIMVRGGVMNENAYVIDGIVLDNVNHYSRVRNPGGSFGFIDMDMVERLDFYMGGVPAGLPSRSSSVIDIALRNGSADKYHHEAELSVLGAGICSEGPLFSTGGTYNLGFRFADMSFLNYFIDESGTPRHADGELKLDFDLRKLGNLSMAVIGSRDVFFVEHDDWVYPIDTYSENGSETAGGALTWCKQIFRWHNTFRFTATHGKTYQLRDNLEVDAALVLDRDIVKDTLWNSVRWNVSQTELTGRRIHKLSLHRQNVGIEDHIEGDAGEHLHLSAGLSGEYKHYYSHYKWSIRKRYYELLFSRSSNGTFSVPLRDTLVTGYGLIDYDNDSVFVNRLCAGYMQLLVTAGRFRITPGVRVEYHSLLDKWGVSPHIGCTYDNEVAGRFSVSGSMIRQLPTMFERLIDRTLCDNCSTLPPMEKLELQRCFQANAAWVRTFTRWGTAGMEVYGKWYDREYPFIEPGYRFYGYHYFIDDNGRSVREIHPPDGRRKVFGVEAYFRSVAGTRFNYAGTFALFRAQDRYTDGYWYDDAYGLCRKLALMAGVK